MRTATRCLLALSVLFGALFVASSPALARDGFYRFPTLRGDTVVFTAEGDLWRVGIAGGRAERITTHPDLESRPALSPDGRSVAFSGAYERAGEAYLMPLDGGVPQRLSFDGQNPRVWGFTPAGEVLVTAPSTRGEPVTQLFAIDPRTRARRALPVGQASDGALGADGQTLFFTRNGLRGDNVRGYRGGAMSRVWRIDLAGSAEAVPLVAAASNSQRPMPYGTPQGQRVAFLDDRDGSVNLWSVDARGGDLRQHTRHQGWDIRHASIDGTRVVYALGADLHLIDLAAAAGQDRVLPVTLGGDADAQRTRWISRAQTVFNAAALSPDGQRVGLSVRGRIATQGSGPLRRAEMPVPADARCRDAVFSHDSRYVFAICDMATPGMPAAAPGLAAGEPAETEVWRFAADGSGSPRQVTRGATVRRLALFPSPDGRWLAHTDQAGHLQLTALTPDLPAQGGRDGQAVAVPGELSQPAGLFWAPDSRAFVYLATDGDRARDRLFLHVPGSGTPAGPGRTLPLVSDRYDTGSAAFTPDGRWLYFLSDRSFSSLNASPWGDRNLGPYFDRRTKVYALALQPGLRFPFWPRDELQPPAEPEAATTVSLAASAPGLSATVTTVVRTPVPAAPAGASSPARGPAPKPAIDTAGLEARLYEVPLAAGNYSKLRTDGRRLYLLEADSTPERRTSLRTLAIESTNPQPELFADGVTDFDVTPDGKRVMLVRRAGAGPQPGDIQLVDAGAKAPADAAVLARAQVRWADWQINTDPAAEWRQIFNDAWRMHRDHFYDAGMHGADWAAARRKYAALLPRVGERGELVELLSQMAGEVGALHSQVFTADLRRGSDDIPPAGLGARLAKVPAGFRIEAIYRSDPELPAEMAPLAIARAQLGDVITQLNGRPLAGVDDLSELLRGQADRQVLLTLQDTSKAERRVVVLPVNAARESQLRTSDWETGNRLRAAARSDGRVGYLRLRAMLRDDIATFAREFYAQLDRDAIVIDVRNNNGGSIDSWIIEKLLRRAWAYWQRRWPEQAPPYPNMQQTFRGLLAVLVDENTYSDGETFAEGVKRLKLGTLVGKRTSGAGVWLSDSNRLIDGGLMRAAESGQFTPGGGWLIEGSGVLPDIEVDNPPRATALGGDAQLDAAVDHLKQRLADAPLLRPQAPPKPRPFAQPPTVAPAAQPPGTPPGVPAPPADPAALPGVPPIRP